MTRPHLSEANVEVISGGRPARLARPATGLAWLAYGFVAAAVVLVGWMVFLAAMGGTALVGKDAAPWIGLDSMEAADLVGIGLLLLRRDVRVRMASLDGVILFAADAVLDVSTSHGSVELVLAVMLAVFVELPLAGGCAVLARRAPHWCAAAG